MSIDLCCGGIVLWLAIASTLMSEISAQVPCLTNGGFEQYDCLPDDFAQIECADGWFNPVSQNCNLLQGDTCASPDYYHVNGSGYGQLPSTNAAYVLPNDGNAVAGLIAWNPVGVREYLTYSLDVGLIPSATYMVEFYATNGITNEQSTFGAGWGIEGLGLAFSTAQHVQADFETLSISPAFSIDSTFFSSEWVKFNFQFTSDSGYNYLTLGNFRSNSLSNPIEFVVTNVIGNTAYYFIDDVSVIRLDTANSVYEWEEAVQHFSQSAEWIRIRLNEQVRRSTATLYDMAGRETGRANGKGNSVLLPLGHLSKGIYMLRIQTNVGSVSRKVVIP